MQCAICILKGIQQIFDLILIFFKFYYFKEKIKKNVIF